MRQLVGFGTILAILVASGWGYFNQRAAATPAADAAALSYAEVRLADAGKRLEQMHSFLGSYSGIGADTFVGMTLAYAGENSYCLQLMREGAWYRLKGPGGQPERGACA